MTPRKPISEMSWDELANDELWRELVDRLDVGEDLPDEELISYLKREGFND